MMSLIESNFIKALDEGKVELLIDCINQGINVNCLVQCTTYEGQFFQRPLHLAAEYGNIDIISCLIKAGARVNGCNSNSETPLHYLLENELYFEHKDGGRAVVSLLLDNGADIFGPVVEDVASLGISPF